MAKSKTINVKGTEIAIISEGTKDEYISLTGIARYRDAERSDYILQNWLRTRSTTMPLASFQKQVNMAAPLPTFAKPQNVVAHALGQKKLHRKGLFLGTLNRHESSRLKI